MVVLTATSDNMNYSFTLILAGAPEITPEAEDSLFEAGCDDALLGSRDGVVYLDFDRAAKSLQAAIQSAIRDVRKAGLGVARIEPDEFVNASEIARRMHRTREGVRKLIAGTRGPGRFPPPVSSVTKASPLWRWSEVAAWLADNSVTEGSPLPEATVIRKINALLEMQRVVGSLSEVERMWRTMSRSQTRAGRRARKGIARKPSRIAATPR
jgi:hypothetical protein